jgi:hypothetical protein
LEADNTLLSDQWLTEEIREEIIKFLEFNENENTTYQNLLDTEKAPFFGKGRKVYRHECIYLKHRKSQINNLMLHHKVLEKQQQVKPKTSRRREIIKIRAKINEMETKKNMQRINETKSCFCEKMNKSDKPLVNLTKMRRKRPKIIKLETKKGR